LFLLEQSQADFFLLCDQDDIWVDSKLEKLLAAAAHVDPNQCHVVCSDAFVFDASGRLSDSFLGYSGLDPTATDLSHVMVQNPVLGCTVLGTRGLRKTVVDGQPDAGKLIMHDWWLALLASGLGAVTVLPEPLVHYRQHSNSQVGAQKYSATNLVRAARNGDAKMSAIVVQARHLLDRHHSDLDAASRAVVEEFLQIFSSRPLRRPTRLVRGRYLKAGRLRAAGQLLFAVRFQSDSE
jgi:hypothetical protein